MSNSDTVLAEDDDLDSSGRSFASIICSGKKLGFACYDEISNTIFADGIHVSEEDMESTLSSMKIALKPSLFLLPPNGTPDFFRYKAMSSSSFNSDIALDILCNKVIVRGSNPTAMNRQTAQQNYLRLSAVLDIDNVLMRQAMCALLQFLQSSVFNLDGGMIQVAAIRPLPLLEYMRLDEGSMRALQIFHEDWHPNVIKGTGRSKEGFSLFGLMDRTRSLPGRQRLR
eukprot:gene8543-17620_t